MRETRNQRHDTEHTRNRTGSLRQLIRSFPTVIQQACLTPSKQKAVTTPYTK
jgi:hypothetical protein